MAVLKQSRFFPWSRESKVSRKIKGSVTSSLLQARQREHPHADFVFLSERKAPLSVNGAQKLIERLGVAAELPFPIHAHMLPVTP